MHPLMTIASRAALNAGRIISRYIDQMDAVTISKKEGNDFVTEIDKMAEKEIINTIHDAYPDHAILAEESGATGSSDYCWVIDPLDGTINYIHGLPFFCVSIAVKYKNRLEHGVIYNPLNNELFTASRGDGAYLNNHRLRVSGTNTLQKSLFSYSLPFRKAENLKLSLAVIESFFTQVSGIRHLGSAALNLAHLAAGRFDGLWAFNQCEWDIAAGILIAQEAGALVSDLSGAENYLTNGGLIAANPKLFKILLPEIQKITAQLPYSF